MAPERLPPLVRATRPRQWVKNLLVFAAPAVAGVLTERAVLVRCTFAALLFVAASAAGYLVNDVADREADRLHPTKRNRPLAAGAVMPSSAIWLALALALLAIGGSLLVSPGLAAVIGVYLVVCCAYTFALKSVPVVELACVASGFVLRAMAGGEAAHVSLSPWFLIVTSFGSLFVVAGKRSVESEVMGSGQGGHRAALTSYPPHFLVVVRMLAAAVTITAYCLWAFDRSSAALVADRLHAHDIVWFELSIIPFVLALLAVELAIEQGRGGEPEDLALEDRTLQVLGLVWLVLLALGVYA